MTKKRFASSAHARQRAKNARHMPDSMLDLTDIPEATDAQLRRLAAKQHKPYQTYIHELLEQAAGKKVA